MICTAGSYSGAIGILVNVDHVCEGKLAQDGSGSKRQQTAKKDSDEVNGNSAYFKVKAFWNGRAEMIIRAVNHGLCGFGRVGD